MTKKILLPLFLLILGILFYQMVSETIDRSVFSQQKIRRIGEDPILRRSHSYLSSEEIIRLQLQYQADLSQLEKLKFGSVVLISLSGIFLLVMIAFNLDFSVKKFDGLTLMIAYLLLICTILAIFKIFTDGPFQDGNNASIKIRTSTEIILLIVAPLIFFTALKMNQLEIKKNLHQAKWISNLAIVLTVLTGFLASVLGIAVLLTPDVSTFSN